MSSLNCLTIVIIVLLNSLPESSSRPFSMEFIATGFVIFGVDVLLWFSMLLNLCIGMCISGISWLIGVFFLLNPPFFFGRAVYNVLEGTNA